jgi:hypothetical protein
MKETTTYFGEVELIPHPATEPMTESLEWLTDLLTSIDGTDTATQIRVAPRQSFSFGVVVDDPAAYVNEAYRSADDQWAVPVWYEAQQAGYDISGGWDLNWNQDWDGRAIIVIDETLGDFRDESLAIVWKSATNYRLLDVKSVESGRLVLADSSDERYNGLLMPVRVGRARVTRDANAALANISVSFNADDNAAITVSAPSQYLSDDIFTDEPLLSSEYLTDEYQTRMDLIDNTTGVISTYTPWTNNRIVRQHRTVRHGLSDGRDLRELLHRRAGRYRPFWMTHHENNLVAVAVGTGTLDVTGYDESRTHISVLANGSHLYRAITSTSDEGGGVTRLNITDLGVTLGEIDSVSYLGLWRLAADRVEISHQAGGIAISTIPIVEVTP